MMVHELIIYGCYDENADNYVDSANVDIPDGQEGACNVYRRLHKF